MNDNFIFNWVLKDKLGIGTCPTKADDVKILKKYKVRNILALCGENEANWHESIEKDFSCERIILPDSNKKKLPSKAQIDNAYLALKFFVNNNITYIHCFAAIERSPLLCIMLIMEKYSLGLEESLDYVKRVHPMTNPRNNQLLFIKNFEIKNN